jgi:hypothetical protein
MERFLTILSSVWSECARSIFFIYIILRSPILHLVIFLCPPANLTTACFSFSGSTVLPPGGSTFHGVLRRVDVISVKDFANSIDVLLCLTIFLLESTLTFQRSCILKSSLLKWNQRCLCLKKIFLKNQAFGQRPNIRISKYTVLWL